MNFLLIQFGCSVFLYGLISTIGFFLATNLGCSEAGNYCIEYADGRLHDVLSFEMLIMIVAILGIFGYIRARYMFQIEDETASRINLEEGYRSHNKYQQHQDISDSGVRDDDRHPTLC